MKTNLPQSLIALVALVILTLSFAARAQDNQQPEPDDDATANPATNPNRVNGATPQNDGTDTNADNEQLVGELLQAVAEAQQQLEALQTNGSGRPDPRSLRPIRGQGTRGTTGSGTNVVSLTALVAKNGTNNANAASTLRLNFRNAPLSLVLDYFSEAAGFTISPNSKVDLKGSITVWSNRPVTRDEAVALLHKSLGEYNYAANVENGNILNIYVLDSSNTEIVPGLPSDFNTIPPTKDLVTQIAYVHNVEANQLINTLQPLMPAGTSMSANQGANAIVITDTKANIRRMAQLVKALDTASVSASEMRVFPLDYADATTLAQVVTQLFQSNDTSQNGRNRGGFGGFPGFGGFGGGDRGRGGDNNSGAAGSASGRVAAARVTAVADERSNSLVVSASAEQMKYIAELVKQMDVDVDDLTELRVFRLRFADPQETADQLASLFPDPTTQQNSRNQQGFRGFFGGGGDNNRNRNSTSQNSRTAKQSRVTAVPDPRTGSVIVSAAQQMMGQIADIIEELDSDPAKKKKVHVIKVENRDPQEVVEELQSIIAQDSNAGTLNNNRSSQTRQTGSQLNSRQQNNLQNQGNNQGGFGNGGNRQFGNN